MKLYNAMLYTMGDGTDWQQPTPNYPKWLRPIKVAYAHNLWSGSDDRDEVPSDAAIRKVVEDAGSRLLCLDIETWPMRVSKSSEQDVNKSLDKFNRTLDRVRHFGPNLRVGVYMYPIARDYWSTVNSDVHEFLSWSLECTRLASRGILDRLDVLFPSLYAFRDDIEQWTTYATMHLKLAKGFNRPVYPFIWPQFHPAAGGGATPLGFVRGAFWKRQLETVAKHADGAVIWGHRKSGSPWDETRPWWQETIKFVESNNA